MADRLGLGRAAALHAAKHAAEAAAEAAAAEELREESSAAMLARAAFEAGLAILVVDLRLFESERISYAWISP